MPVQAKNNPREAEGSLYLQIVKKNKGKINLNSRDLAAETSHRRKCVKLREYLSRQGLVLKIHFYDDTSEPTLQLFLD